MTLKQTIQNNLKESLKQKEAVKTQTIKMLLASILNEEIKLQKKDEGLSDEEVMKVIKSEAKKRNDSIEAFEKAGRTELAEKEKEELEILKAYLPEEMPDEEVKKIVKEVVEETGAASMQDFGKVMKEAMVKIKGQADGNRVSAVVKKLLQ